MCGIKSNRSRVLEMFLGANFKLHKEESLKFPGPRREKPKPTVKIE